VCKLSDIEKIIQSYIIREIEKDENINKKIEEYKIDRKTENNSDNINDRDIESKTDMVHLVVESMMLQDNMVLPTHLPYLR